jgi:hypothetical protein
MPIETLPGAAHLGWLVGMQWPEGDEDSMWALAQDWRNAANSLAGIDSDIDAAISAVRAAYPDGSGGEAMIEQLQAMRKGPQSIDELVTWINTIADSAEQTGNSIESAKIQFNVMLGVLAIETAIAAASLLAGPEEEAIAIAAGRVTARAIIKQLLEDLTVQGLKNAALALLKNIFKKFMLHLALNLAMSGGVDLGTQGWQMLNGHRSSIDWKEVGEVTASGLAGALVGGLAGGLAGKLGAGSLLKSLIGGEAGMLGGWAANGLMTHNWDFDPRMLTAGAFQSVMHHAGEGNSPGAKGFSEPEVRPDELSLPETNDGSVPRSEPVDTTSSDQPPVSANSGEVVDAGNDHSNINADNTVHSDYTGPGDGGHGFSGENPPATTHPAGVEHATYDDVAGQDHSHELGSTGGVTESATPRAGVYSFEGSSFSGGDRAGVDDITGPESPISAGAGEGARTPVASTRPQTTGDGSSSYRPAQSETPAAQGESPLTSTGTELSGASDLPSADYAPTDKPFNPLFDQPISDDRSAGDFQDGGSQPIEDAEYAVPDDISGIDATPAPPEPPIRAGLADDSQHPADPARPASRPGTPRELSSPIRARSTGTEPGSRAGDSSRTSDRAGRSERADHPYELAGAVARGDDGSPPVAEHPLPDNDSPPPDHPGENPRAHAAPPEDAREGEDGTRHTPEDGTSPREPADPHPVDQEHPGAHHDSTHHTSDDPSTHPAESGHPEPPSIEDAFADHAEPTEAGLSLHGGDDHMGDLPHRVPADDRYFTVDAHITEDGYVRIGGHEYTPEELGRMLRENGWDGAKPIRLIGCDAAENGFGSRLAAHLGTDVLAPTAKAWTDENGRVYTSSPEPDGNGNLRPRIPPDGEWHTMHPDGTMLLASDDGFVPGTPEEAKHGLDPDGAHERAAAAVGKARLPERYPRPDYDKERTISGKDVPGKRTAFAARKGLDPKTLYHVEGRGDFYTDGDGRVTYVEATYGEKGNLNPDLHKPQPDTTYVVHPDIENPTDGVSHAHVFQTDGKGRVVTAHTDAYALGDADRSDSVQQRVGKLGGTGYDGGHSLANFAGGGPERINVDPMLAAVNRGSGDSFYNLEGLWRQELGVDPPPVIPVTIRKVFDDDGVVPAKFKVRYRIGNGPWNMKEFVNAE